jgi:hypothetical protein
MSGVELQFRRLLELEGDSRPREAFDRFAAEVQGLRNILLGDDSAFLALLRRLVLTSISQISAHFNGAVESLRREKIECRLSLAELPPRRGIFVAAADLLTCLTAITANIRTHAFPADGFRGQRSASIEGRVVREGQYILEFRDFGVGTPSHLVLNEASSDNGLVVIRRFADAYGAELRFESMTPGFCVHFGWDLVDI